VCGDVSGQYAHGPPVVAAANEPYALWEGLDRSSPEYKALKEERVECLWEALQSVIPDIKERTVLKMVSCQGE